MELFKKEKDASFYNHKKKGMLDYINISPLHKYLSEKINFRKDVRILDMGCGFGKFAIELYKNGYLNYIGIDFSEDCINIANKNIKFNGYSFLVRDINRDNIEELIQFSEVIFFIEVLEHMEDDVTILKKIKDKQIIISVPNFDSEAHVRLFLSEDEVIERYGFLKENGNVRLETCHIIKENPKKSFILFFNC